MAGLEADTHEGLLTRILVSDRQRQPLPQLSALRLTCMFASRVAKKPHTICIHVTDHAVAREQR